MDKKDLQKKYVQLYLVREQLKAMAEEKSAIEAKLNEFLVSVEAISKLEGVKAGEEIWSPLGSGIFVRSGIKDTENVLVSIGAGIVVKRPGKDALEILKARLEELVNIDTQLTAEMEKLKHQGDSLEKQLEELADKSRT
ncbi:MAG: prefoldin subunit alpha [Candidatus Aenigmarchaeota archaeon]|nr:prefoldin subunit alpha [Candidatus Aenigmarchaeota archaeon]